MEVDLLYNFSFQFIILSFRFCAFQFVTKSLTTLDIKTYYRLMCCDLNSVYVLCISVLIQQLLCFNLTNKGLSSSLNESFCTNLCIRVYLIVMVCKL
jgi:hypothetical protein